MARRVRFSSLAGYTIDASPGPLDFLWHSRGLVAAHPAFSLSCSSVP